MGARQQIAERDARRSRGEHVWRPTLFVGTAIAASVVLVVVLRGSVLAFGLAIGLGLLVVAVAGLRRK